VTGEQMRARHRWARAERQPRGEDGAILIIALIFMVVFGLTAGALLTEAQANVKNTVGIRNHETKIYGADAGLQYGLSRLRSDLTLCPNTNAGVMTLPPFTVNGRSITVTCKTIDGSTVGADGFGVITTWPTPASASSPFSLDLTNNNALRKLIGGSAFISGDVNWGPNLTLRAGDFLQETRPSTTCATGGRPAPTIGTGPTPSGQLYFENSDGSVGVGRYEFLCMDPSASPAWPDPPHSPPSSPPPAPTLAPKQIGSCTDFLPGTYTVPPTLVGTSTNYYFESGVYYFDFASPAQWTIKQGTAYGGIPSTSETRKFPVPGDGCASADTRESPNGTGVEFIFGGGSAVYLNTSGDMELFARCPTMTACQHATATAEGTPGLSLVGVPSDWPTTGPGRWDPYTGSCVLAAPCIYLYPLIDMKNGNNPDVGLHGLVYAPAGDVSLAATNDVVANILGGVVAQTLTLQSSASATGLAVSTSGGPGARTIVLTAAAPGLVNGAPPRERQVQAQAVITVQNDANRTVAVQSWRSLACAGSSGCVGQ